MIFCDTNILVYSSLMTLDKNKYETSNNLLSELISEDALLINPLVLSEYIFVLSKLKIDENVIEQGINQFKDFVYSEISKDTILEAYKYSKQFSFGRNINDIIHIIVAESYCDKLYTFDKDFKIFIGKTNIEIEILK